jgi:retron-type reverse transcriptase
MSNTDLVARNLAAAFLDGAWSAQALRQRGGQALGCRDRWLAGLVRRVLAAFAAPPGDEVLARFIAQDRGFHAGCGRSFRAGQLPLRRLYWVRPNMAPALGPPEAWPVPALPTPGALADWLGLTPAQMDWFADCGGREARTPPGPLRHYLYRWLPGRRGKQRLIEQPRPRLKALQRRILAEVLDRIPAHPAAHGYCKGRSVRSYAEPHVGQQIVLRLDLRDFFPSLRAARARALFRTAGYPPEVARLLAGLCTNVVPPDVLQEGDLAGQTRALFEVAHLPQGAPTSPALANLCAFRLDCRLSRLASRVKATYTRYADDLAFSGGAELARSARRFHVLVGRIALEEGFEVNTRKTRFMRRAGRQHLAGAVLNERLNCPRESYDRLKATLTNCLRHGPAGQNRAGVADFRAHLVGRIAHLTQLNPSRGERLRQLFERIEW